MSRPRIALVSRELAPRGGGIGAFVAATAELLAPVAEVTVFTTAGEGRAARHPAAGIDGVRTVFLAEPVGFELGSFRGRMHLWSARIRDALRAHYGARGPDLVEFQDFLGEGMVTAQDRRAGAPWLAATTVCVRVNTTAELCDVLNGHLRRDRDSRVTFDLEREALRLCDHVLWAGGDVLGTYRRFYGDDGLATPVRVRQPFAAPATPASPSAPAADGGASDRVRLLYLGRLERRKGVLELIRAVSGLARDDWRLTLVGADSDTGPLGASIRAMAELAAGRDPRVELREPVARSTVAELIDAHDVVVLPSRWECWPNVGLEALARDRPLVATPVGGLLDMCREGQSGWLADGTAAESIAAALERALDAGRECARRPGEPGPRGVLEELVPAEEIRAMYLELCESGAPAGAARQDAGAAPLVSVVVPYFRLPQHVGEAVDSALAQTHRELEVIVVNDGSFEDRDVLAELARRPRVRVVSQPNAGLGAARNLGIAEASGSYVLPLDADNVLEPGFVARCVALLEAAPELPYATSWSRFIDERGRPWRGVDDGERPIGSRSRLLAEENVAGDAVAVFRREVLRRHGFDPELTSYEDWDLFRRLAEAGMHGIVIPEALVRYRVRAGSMARAVGDPHRGRLIAELEASAVATRTGLGEPSAAHPAAAAAARARLESDPAAVFDAAAASRLAAGPPPPGAGPARRLGSRLLARVRGPARRLALRLLR